MTPEEKEAYRIFESIRWDIDVLNGNPILTDKISKQVATYCIEFALQFVGGDLEEEFDKILYLVKLKEEIKKL